MVTRFDIEQRQYLAQLWAQLAPRYVDGTLREFGGSRVFFVDGINGDNGNIGTEPSQPWQTIVYALTQCVADRDDYIFVLDCWQQEVAWPITVNVSRVHIIGIANPIGQFPAMQPADNNPVFLIQAAGRYSEIAGFNLGGWNDVTNTSGCLHLGQAIGVWIHHIDMGSTLAGGQPQDGIRFVDGNAQSALIEDCRFIGVAGAKGTLTRNGIFQPAGGGSRCLNAVIRNNIFMNCDSPSMELLNAEGVAILDNVFGLVSDTQGLAITLGITSEGCIVAGNKALFGTVTAAMTQNPYLDNGAAAPNHWMANYKGNALIDPA